MGHHFGADSREYQTKAMKQDVILANQVFDWMERGYQIIITSDHGMNDDDDDVNNGNTPAER